MPLNTVRCDWSPKTNYRRGRGGAGLKEKNYKENKYASSARDRARRRRAERAAKWDRQTNQFTEEKQDNAFETGRFDDAPWPEHLIEYTKLWMRGMIFICSKIVSICDTKTGAHKMKKMKTHIIKSII